MYVYINVIYICINVYVYIYIYIKDRIYQSYKRDLKELLLEDAIKGDMEV